MGLARELAAVHSSNSDRRVPVRCGPDRDATKVYLVGGGIASMAAAAFMIRDGDILGRNITIIEETDRLGGSLDGAGSALDGYPPARINGRRQVLPSRA